MRVLLTRPLEDSRAVADALEAEGTDAEGIECLIWPLTRIVPTAAAPRIPPGTGGLLFTSANAVRAFAARMARRDLPALCVGEATAAAARRAGFAQVRSAGGDARALADLARRSGIGSFLHPRGRDAAGDLAGWLRESGQRVAEAVLYEAAEAGAPPAPVAAALGRGAIDLVTVWSRRAAAILAARLGGQSGGHSGGLGGATVLGADLSGTDLLAISESAAEPLSGVGFRRTIVAESPSGDAMLKAIGAAARASDPPRTSPGPASGQ